MAEGLIGRLAGVSIPPLQWPKQFNSDSNLHALLRQTKALYDFVLNTPHSSLNAYPYAGLQMIPSSSLPEKSHGVCTIFSTMFHFQFCFSIPCEWLLCLLTQTSSQTAQHWLLSSPVPHSPSPSPRLLCLSSPAPRPALAAICLPWGLP